MKKTTRAAAEKRYQEQVIKIPKPVLYVKYEEVVKLLNDFEVAILVKELNKLDMFEPADRIVYQSAPPTYGGD